MGKLFKLKRWLTVEEAARHLTIVFGEDVSEADVFRLALDGELTLSVNFVNGAYARLGELVPIIDAKYREAALPGHPSMRLYEGPRISTDGVNSHILELEKSVARLVGVWDLPMIGGEHIDAENHYQRLTGGPAATNVPMEGAFVQSTDGRLYQLQDDFDDNEHFWGSAASMRRIERDIKAQTLAAPEAELLLEEHREARKTFLEDRKSILHTERFYAGGHLPDDAVFVVRIDALRDLEETVNGLPESVEKTLGTSERNQLLKMVLGMAIDSYGFDPVAKKNEATKQIADDLAKLGIGIDTDTVRKYLKAAASTVTYELPKR